MTVKKLLVIIPAYNEEKCIVQTVQHLKAVLPDVDYVVINDGSSDATSALCRENGYRCIDLPVNVGLAYAVKCGMIYAHREGYEYAMQFDADGQHDANYIQPLLEAMQRENLDVAIGSRFLNAEMPVNMRMVGSRMIRGLIRLFSGQTLTDPTSGMRMYNRRMIRAYATMANMTPEPDTISYLIRCGVRVADVPAVMHERTAGESMFSFYSSARYMVHMFFSLCFVQLFRKKDIKL